MTRCKNVLILLLLLLLASSPAYAATTVLYDWAFNLNGDTYEKSWGDPLPTNLDDSSFDWNSGLGMLSLSFVATEDDNNYSAIAFFDHEIIEATNTYYNEFGAVVGTPEAGQSWEIDEPSYSFGDIYWNVLDGILDNANGVPEASPEDVSMALGWDLSLLTGDTVLIEFAISDIAPISGFYLTHTDPASDYSIYFSSTASVTPIPEPGTILLLGAGIIGIFVGRKYLS